MAQEEPVYMGPYLIEVLRARRRDVVALAVAPQRSVAGKETAEQREAMWLMLEPWYAVKALATRRVSTLLGLRSIARAAERLGIPVIPFEKANDAAFLDRLRALEPDVIFNQSELLLKEEILGLPRLGVVNRHGSSLPRYRGRVGSWWAHAAGEPEIGITVHFVDAGIDSGAIIHQERFPSDARWPYGRVMEAMFRHSPGVVLLALERLERPDFKPRPNEWQAEGSPARKFPTLDEVRAYRAALAKRRAS